MATTPSPNRPYRLLALDGGGTWALVQIMALQHIFQDEHIRGHTVLKHFDLIVANSGGSIAAMAMAEDWPLSQILHFYLTEERRRQVFVKLSFWEKGPLRQAIKGLTGLGPKYRTRDKLQGLRKVLPDLGDNLLSQVPGIIGPGSPHFLFPTFEYDRERTAFFRSDRQSKAQTHVIAQERGQATSSSFEEVTVAQALHASTNAPLQFFNEPAVFDHGSKKPQKRYWDGAVGGYNNPVMAGLTEAISNGVPLERIQILSIGSGNDFRPIRIPGPGSTSAYPILCQEPQKQTLGNDIQKMAKSILSDPPDAATFTAYTLLHALQQPATPRLVRMNPLIQPVKRHNRWELPEGLNENEFRTLVELDLDALEQRDVNLVHKFGGLWLADKIPNQPIRMDNDLRPVLGHGRFGEAMAAARQLLGLGGLA